MRRLVDILSMKTYVINNERGLTLIELLAGLVVSTVILGLIYGVTLMGMNQFNLTSKELQYRSEADYLIKMVLNEMYEFSPDRVTDDDNTLILAKEKAISIADDGIIEEKEAELEEKSIRLEAGQLYVGDTPLLTGNVRLEEGSSLTVTCNEESCESGIIDIVFILSDPNAQYEITPLKVESSFGF
ncbi:prepilin-type N-terminal cleavage/methylation domain-containing protein [Alkalihalobacillus sp. LMS39]|uniref:type IV pilus modification PilV family protein n=1 Tax=Alkalihalobacillus sp. LMS39 TaxID=2924032 RepID=UPI001FB4AFE6|nr:prepilin-type N-terminal cleavage/methylation domain-containing protein [Alkalihalobacillus sp. LMS39]UOE93317.1 prepilin-type N-terminal cleavage/methylation domain-containing protein [Alkalihalobacillus sp. LMS39]